MKKEEFEQVMEKTGFVEAEGCGEKNGQRKAENDNMFSNILSGYRFIYENNDNGIVVFADTYEPKFDIPIATVSVPRVVTETYREKLEELSTAFHTNKYSSLITVFGHNNKEGSFYNAMNNIVPVLFQSLNNIVSGHIGDKCQPSEAGYEGRLRVTNFSTSNENSIGLTFNALAIGTTEELEEFINGYLAKVPEIENAVNSEWTQIADKTIEYGKKTYGFFKSIGDRYIELSEK